MRERQGRLDTEGRPCEDGSRDWSDATVSQESLLASSSWSRHRTESPPDSPQGAWPCPHSGFGPVTLRADFWPPELWDDKSPLPEATKFEVVCYSSLRRLIHKVRRKLLIFYRINGPDQIGSSSQSRTAKCQLKRFSLVPMDTDCSP